MKLLAYFFVLAFALPAMAQQSRQIEADRPGESQNPSVVPHKKFQAEISIQREEYEDEYDIFHPDALLRYGLFKNLELRAQFQDETQKFAGVKDALTGLKPVELGFKLALFQGKGAMPDVSLLSQFGIPSLSSSDFKTPNILPMLRLLMQNKLSEKFKLGYNLGIEWEEPEQPPTWLYTLSPELDVTDHWHIYLEAYGKFRKDAKPEEVLNASLAWLPTNHIQIDLNGGAGLSSEAPKYFVSAGFSFRL